MLSPLSFGVTVSQANTRLHPTYRELFDQYRFRTRDGRIVIGSETLIASTPVPRLELANVLRRDGSQTDRERRRAAGWDNRHYLVPANETKHVSKRELFTTR